MHGNRRVVISKSKKPPSELPASVNEGSILVQWLIERGHWGKLQERVRVVRQGGFAGIDLLLFFLLYFASRVATGIKQFSAETVRYRSQLAALGLRRDFPSPSSVSRALSSVQEQDSRQLAPWLLLEATEAREVLRQQSTNSYDTRGNAWHFFDWDGSNTVLRQRALPAGPDLPEARRRSSDMAAPGYTGRKRGEVKFSRGLLQHAGSGLWVGQGTSRSGRADSAAMFAEIGVPAIRATCEYGELPVERAVARSDGAGGNVPWIATCQRAGIHYVTRSAHYTILEQPGVKERLARSVWYEVPSSGSGPSRQATELGDVVLEPARSTRGEDGEAFEPVHTRMVVSRFAASEKRGAGILIDGWQYELYPTDLPADAWPAPETVEVYYARGGEENRFPGGPRAGA